MGRGNCRILRRGAEVRGQIQDGTDHMTVKSGLGASPLLPFELELYSDVILLGETAPLASTVITVSVRPLTRQILPSIPPGSWVRKLWVCPGPAGTWQDGCSGAVQPNPA